MEYTVGSLADLITGKSTANKPSKSKKIKLSNDIVQSKDETSNDIVQNKDEAIATTVTVPVVKLGNKTKKKEKLLKQRPFGDKPLHRNPEEQTRTVFVGNVPIGINKKKIQRYFKKYGIVKSVRFRGDMAKNPHTPKVMKDSLPERKSCYCFVSFTNEEDALKAEQDNGTLFEGHHLNIDLCSKSDNPHDVDKSIFVGNLSFDAEDDDLWEVFQECGEISRVRIVRDSVTGRGKGFAYVNFKDSDAVQLALEMEHVKIKNREVRIKINNPKAPQKIKKNAEKGLRFKKQKPSNKNKKNVRINKSLQKNIKNIAPRRN